MGLIAVTSPGGEGCAGFWLRLPGSRAPRLSSYSPQAWLLCSVWDLPRSGSNLCLLSWQADFLPLSPQGSLQLKKKKNYWTHQRKRSPRESRTPNIHSWSFLQSQQKGTTLLCSRPHPRKHWRTLKQTPDRPLSPPTTQEILSHSLSYLTDP